MFFTLFWSENIAFAEIFKTLRRVFSILIFIGVTIHLIHEYPKFLQNLLMTMCWAAAIFGIGYILFHYSRYPFPDSRLRGTGQLFNPINAASIYGIALIACIYLLQQQNTLKNQLIYLGILSIIISFILLSQSRGPLIATSVAMLAWSMATFFRGGEAKKKCRGRVFLVLLFFFTIGGVLLILFPDFLQSFFNRGASYRLEIWKNIFTRFMNAPFFGHGLNADAQSIMDDGHVMLHPHSVYLATAYHGGIIGLLLLLTLIVSALRQGFRKIGDSRKSGLTYMLIIGVLCMVTDGHTLINHPKPFWFFFWFPIALLAESELSTEDRR